MEVGVGHRRVDTRSGERLAERDGRRQDEHAAHVEHHGTDVAVVPDLPTHRGDRTAHQVSSDLAVL
jgi:hypothetical protein